MNVTKDATWSAFAERRRSNAERKNWKMYNKTKQIWKREKIGSEKKTHKQQSVVRTRCGHPFDLVCLDMFSFLLLLLFAVVISVVVAVYICAHLKGDLSRIFCEKISRWPSAFSCLTWKRKRKIKRQALREKKEWRQSDAECACSG